MTPTRMYRASRPDHSKPMQFLTLALPDAEKQTAQRYHAKGVRPLQPTRHSTNSGETLEDPDSYVLIHHIPQTSFRLSQGCMLVGVAPVSYFQGVWRVEQVKRGRPPPP